MVAYFRKNNARVILDLSFTKFLPIEEIREHTRPCLRLAALAIRMRSLAIGCSSIPADALELIREFDRAMAAERRLRRTLRQRSGDTACRPAIRSGIRSISSPSRPNRPIMILTGLTGIGQGLPGGDGYVLDHGHPRHIDLVAARYPGLKVLAARPAYPWQDEMLAILAHKPNVSYELHGWGPRQFSPSPEESNRWPFAGPRDVRLRFSRS